MQVTSPPFEYIFILFYFSLFFILLFSLSLFVMIPIGYPVDKLHLHERVH